MNDLKTLRDAWETPEAPSRDAHAAARAALLARARDHTHTHRGRTRPQHRFRVQLPRIGVRLVAAGALAVAIVAGVTVVQNAGGVDERGRPRSIVPFVQPGPAANAAEALERAAVAAEARASSEPRPDQWVYISSFHSQRVWELWQRVDGEQYAYIEDGKLKVVGVEQGGRHRDRDRHVPKPPWTYLNLTKLPTDPDALLRWAYSQAGDRRAKPSEVYNLFNAILRNGGVMPPRLEAAIYRALKQVPGVELIRDAGTVRGHPVLAVRRIQDGWLDDRLLLDRKTYAYRGERAVVLTDSNPKEPAEKGQVGYGERIAAAIVDQAGQRP